MTVQAYVSLGADSGGEAIKKEIGADLEYFSVNIQLGVSSALSRTLNTAQRLLSHFCSPPASRRSFRSALLMTRRRPSLRPL